MVPIKKQLRIGGMTCVNCQNKIEKTLRNTAGIQKASVSYTRATADIIYDAEVISLKDICKIIEKLDYQVLPENAPHKTDIPRAIYYLILILALYAILRCTGVLNLLAPSQLADTKMSYGMLFIIGLTTSVHCIAMCGGINLSQCLPSGRTVNNGTLSTFTPSILYNLGRVISYTFIGFILGGMGMLLGSGSGVGLSSFLQGILKLIAGIFMIISGMNMLNIFPGLRRFTLRLPRLPILNIGGKIQGSSGPLITGLLNGLMPCGPLQSMQIVALASANPFLGAFSMLSFSLGTVPLMLCLGSIVSALGKKFSEKVMRIGSVLVVVLGLAMVSQGNSLIGFIPSFPGTTAAPAQEESAEIIDGTQIVESTLTLGRYPNITVQAGVPVKWIINAPSGSINACNHKMLIPDFGIEYTFQEGENVIEFTPTETGTIQYTCWMGMIHGNIFVTDKNTDSGTETTASDVPVPAGYQIPSESLALPEMLTAPDGSSSPYINIRLTENGFEPAIVVVEAGSQVLWAIQNDLGEAAALLIPDYSTKLSLSAGENAFYLYPQQSFEVSTGDHAFYAYVKVVDDIENIDESAIRSEVEQFETLIYPDSIFNTAASGGSCCQ